MSEAVENTAEPGAAISQDDSPSINKSTETLDDYVQSKHASIAQACQANDMDILIRLATSAGGLLNDELRRKACT